MNNRTVERTLPHNLEAERSLLGAVLLHSEALNLVADLAQPNDFFRDAHRRIYAAMLMLHEAGTPIDLTTLRAELQRTGDLDEVGGPAYIAALVDGVPRSTNVEHYARIIVEQSRLRQGIYAANKLVARAYEAEEDAASLLGAAADELFTAAGAAQQGRAVPLSEIMLSGMEAIERAHRAGGIITGVATGFTDLDEITAGLQPADLVLVAARTSIGKTALVLGIARHVARAEMVLMHSLEMSRLSLFIRMLAAEAHVDSHRLRAGFLSERDWGRLAHAMAKLGEAKLFIDDTPGIGVLEVRARARSLRAQHGLALLVVDYIQLMRGRGRFDNRTQELGTISRGLKGLAKELQVPVLATAQLNRSPEGRRDKRPQLSDLRESGDLENDADVVALIYRAEAEDGAEDPPAELIVAKQRTGPTGTVKLAFVRQWAAFENLAGTEVPA